jgi:hypothetical protein
MSVVKDEKPLWRAGLALSGPVIVLGITALAVGLINRTLLASGALRGFFLAMMGLSVLALAMLLWGLRRGSRRLRRWDVRLSILANIALLGALVFVQLFVRPGHSTQTDLAGPQSVTGDSGSVTGQP